MEITLRSRIGEWYEQSGLRKSFIAKELGITTHQLNNYISGSSHPNAQRLFILAELFRCKVDDLYEVIKCE